MKTARCSTIALGLLLMGACGPAQNEDVGAANAPVAVVSAAPTTVASATPTAVDEIRLLSVKVPEKAVVDGALSEWTDLGHRSVAIAISNDQAFLVGQLDTSASDGVWVSLASKPSKLPPVGDQTRGGGIRPFDCEHEYSGGMFEDSGRLIGPNPPEKRAACELEFNKANAFEAAHIELFSKRFKIDKGGVYSVGHTGELAAIPDAKVAFVTDKEGLKFEVSLPLSALPRLSQAPLMSLDLWVATGERLPEPLPKATTVVLPGPLTFEPLGQIRNAVFADLSQPGAENGMYLQSSGISYQPGDLLHVETMRRKDPKTIFAVTQVLYEPKATLGNLEIGRIDELVDAIAIFKDGKLIDRVTPRTSDGASAEFRGIAKRGDEVLVFSYAAPVRDINTGYVRPYWIVTAIAADGTYRTALDDQGFSDFMSKVGTRCIYDLEGKETSSKSFDTLGFRGSCGLDEPKLVKRVSFEVTWQWDTRAKMYFAKARKVASQGNYPKAN